MTSSVSRLIVVRAWRDTDRLVVRFIVGADDVGAVESVFSDVGAATARLAEVLSELVAEPPEQPETKR